jgi:hypothetical protein
MPGPVLGSPPGEEEDEEEEKEKRWGGRLAHNCATVPTASRASLGLEGKEKKNRGLPGTGRDGTGRGGIGDWDWDWD